MRLLIAAIAALLLAPQDLRHAPATPSTRSPPP